MFGGGDDVFIARKMMTAHVQRVNVGRATAVSLHPNDEERGVFETTTFLFGQVSVATGTRFLIAVEKLVS
jgi:hypothetical protein